ncbi:unnamed protein product [Ilex paraguariensis]|uniref:Condensin complex subunit 2 n=1 Tax=Ilex paraguariensis TaxID=185542 RepID=A0ABC8T3A3_9AQUA
MPLHNVTLVVVVVGSVCSSNSETVSEGDNIKNGQDEGRSMKEIEMKMSPLSTLEPSFEALNVKKFDVAFAVDPLYHQTSAQFDEGGAKGLLLNNLGVYGGCRVLFDSLEVPRKCMSCSIQNTNSDMIDISFAREYVEQMLMNMPRKNEISPTFRKIVCQFEEDNQKFSHAFTEGQKSVVMADSVEDINHPVNDNPSRSFETGNFGPDEDASVVDESFNFGDTTSLSHNEESHCYASYEADVEGKYEEFALCSEEFPATKSRTGLSTKRPTDSTPLELDIDFIKFLDQEFPGIFAPPKNPRSLLLPANRMPGSNTLPEDCHYQPEDLVKLFLLHNVMPELTQSSQDFDVELIQCFGEEEENFQVIVCFFYLWHIMPLGDDGSWQHNNNFDEQLPTWDNDNLFGGQYDDDCVHSDLEDSDGLVSHPRQVTKIEVQYDKTSKQVDVHVLRETLWDHIQESVCVPETVCKDTVSFKHVLATFPEECQTAQPEDISPHLCFICLLHLANEHCLSITNCPTFDELTIYLPSHGKHA